MKRRPLCIAALLLVLLLWSIPKGVWLETPDIPSGETFVLTGTVTKREQKEEKQAYYLKDCRCEKTASEFSVLAYTPKGDQYPVGCRLSLYGTIYQLSKADNPGQFDGESYYQSQGILYTFQAERALSYEGGGFFREGLTRIREFLGEKIMEICNERDGGILKAVLLGDKSSLREEDQTLYQKNGISHLLAISGLHISMIGVGLYQFLRKCRLTFVEAGIPSGLLIFCYGMLTGFGVSAIRAVSMFLVMLTADILGRAYDMASAMALAALIILIRNPLQAWQAGFLLSFGAVVGICVVYPILQSLFPVQRKAGETVLFSISLALVTYPLTVHFYYEYPVYSMLLNFIVIPLMPFVMGFGGIGMFCGIFSSGLGRLAVIPAHLVLSLYELLGTLILKLPAPVARLGCEEPWQLVVYYGLLAIALLGIWYGRRRIFVLMLPAALFTVTLRFHSFLEITMLDVGQGDGIFLRLPGGTTCMIDGGSTNVKNLAKYRLLPFLKHEGIAKLDYVIFTHLDEDHISGMRELLEMSSGYDGVEIGTMLFPAIGNPDEKYEDLRALAEESGVKTGTIGAGDHLTGKNWSFDCLYPVKNSIVDDKNASSTVMSLKAKEFSMLFTGDLAFDGEAALLWQGVLEQVDVWKVSHHGSKYSGSESFLEKIRPQLGMISVGRNTYGHPSEELLARLRHIGTYVQTTIESGALMLESDGKTFSLALQRGGD